MVLAFLHNNQARIVAMLYERIHQTTQAQVLFVPNELRDNIARGAAAFLAAYAAEFYVLTRTLSCDTQRIFDATSTERCAANAVLTATVVELAANAIILGVAPVAGYGFGYDAAAKRSATGHGFRLSLAPALITGGAGLRLTARF